MSARLPRARLLVLFHESWKYFLVSLLSLGVDQGIFWLLVHGAHIFYPLANVVSVMTGLAVNYALSVTMVFKERRLSSRWAEFAGFIAVGVAGLAVNEAFLVGLVGGLGLAPVIGKLAAAGPSFLFNFAVRRVLLFTAPKPSEVGDIGSRDDQARLETSTPVAANLAATVQTARAHPPARDKMGT